MSKNKANTANYIESFENYKTLLEILKKGNFNTKTFYKYNQGDIIQNADLTVEKLNSFLQFIGINKNYKILDIGCGLGIITNEIGKKNNFKNTYACEPSEYAAKFINLYYPKIRFIKGGIEEIGNKYINFFDVLYLREVSPFRRGNLNLHKKLIKKMRKLIKKDGTIIFEQILNKGRNDIFKTLKKTKINYKIYPSIPYFLIRNKLSRNLLLKNYKIVNFILNISDKIFFHYLKKKTYYIVINRN